MTRKEIHQDPQRSIRGYDSAFGGDAGHYQPPCQAACRYHMCEAVDMAVPGGCLHD